MSGLLEREDTPNAIRHGIVLNVHDARQKVEEATEAYQAQLKEVTKFFEQMDDNEQLPNMLKDDAWKAPNSEDFKTKYLKHKFPVVKKLAELHAAELSMHKNLLAVEAELEQVELDAKSSKMSDGDRVIKHTIEELCFQLKGVTKEGVSLRHSVVTGPALHGAIEVGKPTSISFVARDEGGKPVLDLTNDVFQVLIDGLADDGAVEIPYTIKRGKTLNIFTFTFTLPQAGKYRIAIWLGKLPLEGSPYMVLVGPDPAQARILQDLHILRVGCYNMCSSNKWKQEFGVNFDFAANGYDMPVPTPEEKLQKHIEANPSWKGTLEASGFLNTGGDPHYNPFVKPS